MEKHKAKKAACRVVSRLIESYNDAGQPWNDCTDGVNGWTEDDYEALAEAFELIRQEMLSRGYDGTTKP